MHVTPLLPQAVFDVVPASLHAPVPVTQPWQLKSRQVPALHCCAPTHGAHALPPVPQPWLFWLLVEMQTPLLLQQPLHEAAQEPASAPPPPPPPVFPPPVPPKLMHVPRLQLWFSEHVVHAVPLEPHALLTFPG